MQEAEEQDDHERVLQGRVQAVADQLGKDFDAVQVLASKVDADGNTITIAVGTGNWYARYGQIRDWLVTHEEHTRVGVRRQTESED